MTRPPCYDIVNHKDCPDRAWCLQVGRSKCKRWVDYENAHRAELEAINREKQFKRQELEYFIRVHKRVNS